jgi:ABC-type glycerol-3-phosphate transport system substrate-binding protein
LSPPQHPIEQEISVKTTRIALRAAAAAAMIGSGLMLAGCGGDPPQTTSSTTEETTTTQAPVPVPQMAPAPMPGAPGTVTTQTTHSETMPAQ